MKVSMEYSKVYFGLLSQEILEITRVTYHNILNHSQTLLPGMESNSCLTGSGLNTSLYCRLLGRDISQVGEQGDPVCSYKATVAVRALELSSVCSTRISGVSLAVVSFFTTVICGSA